MAAKKKTSFSENRINAGNFKSQIQQATPNNKEIQIQKALRELKKQEFFEGYTPSDIRRMKSVQQLINEGLDAVEHDQYRFSVGVINTAIRRLAIETYNQNQPKLTSSTVKKKK